MNFLIPLLLIISAKAFSCDQKIDESKVMIFLDTNFSDLEIETAKRAACKRGEKIQIIPKNYKEYTSQIRVIEGKLKKLQACKQNCESLQKEYTDAQIELIHRREREGDLDILLKKELKEIRNSKAKLSNFIISGHDGGGNFGGHKGSLSREDIDKIMEDFKDINDVSTLMLLGCYTGVQKEIAQWKGIFPKVKMIAGYDGSAPLSDKPMGHHYLEDLLTKEKNLLKQADEKKLNEYVKANIRGLHSMHSAVYLETQCNENEENPEAFYYGSLSSKRFSTFNLKQCMSKAAEIKDIEKRFQKFDLGEVEPPKNPSDPVIKTLYDKARSLEHCIEEMESTANVNSIFNLRFYEAVKENFATFYKNEIGIVEEALKNLNFQSAIEEIDKEMAKVADLERKLEEENQQIKKDPKAYFANLDAKIYHAEKEINNLLDDPEKSAILKKMQNPLYEATTAEEALYKKYYDLKEEHNLLTSKTWFKNNPQHLVTANEMKLQTMRFELKANREALTSFDKNGIWIPNLENLKKHSRKEMRDNLHRISGLLAQNILPRKVRLSLKWALEAQQQHLIYFQNPFEWHEVTARVTAPPGKVEMGEKLTPPQGQLPGFSLGTLGGQMGGIFEL